MLVAMFNDFVFAVGVWWSKDGLISPSLDHHTPTAKTKSLNIATNINHNIMIYNHNLAKHSFATGVRKILSEER